MTNLKLMPRQEKSLNIQSLKCDFVKINLKLAVIIEALVIIALCAALLYQYSDKKIQIQGNAVVENNNGLLSPRIYAGLLPPKSYLIVNFAPLKEELQNYITKNSINVSVYVENLRNGAYMGINEKNGFFPTSLNKLPVAIIIMGKIERGELSFETTVPIEDSKKFDTTSSLYNIKEKELPLRVLMEKLLKESDNVALASLLNYVTAEDLQLVFDYYGIDISAGYPKANPEHVDLISPKSMSNLFSSLYFSTVLEPSSSEYLLNLLTDSVFDIKKLSDIPENVRVAQKFGANYYANHQFFHDCGIIYIDESRIFYCIMTKGLDEEHAEETIGYMVHEIYSYVVDTKTKFQSYKP